VNKTATVLLTMASMFLSARCFAIDTGPAPGRNSNMPLTVSGGDHFGRILRVQGDHGNSIGGWQLVRTPGPEKRDIISIMHVADTLKSDPDFAGLMIRCRPKSQLQIGLILVRPFPPRAHLRVSISAGSTPVKLEASVVPPGSVLILPDEAGILAKGPWQSANQLSVDIEDTGEKIHGVVPLEDLKNAISFLQSNCQEL
jgi:hypothetical protein